MILFISIKSFSQWTQISVPTVSGLNDVLFIDENVGYCVGGGDLFGYPNETNGIILKTTNAGLTWNVVYTENNIAINYIGSNQNIIYAFGRNAEFSPILLTSLDNGLNWNTVMTTFQAEKVITYNNIIYFIDNINDLSLTKFHNNTTETIINDVSIFSVNNYGIIKINDNGNNIKYSSDFGLNWIDLNEHPTEFGQNQLLFAKIKQIEDEIIVYGTYPSGILYSNDFGNNWEYNYVNILPATIMSSSIIYGISSENEDNEIVITNYNGSSTNMQTTVSNSVKKIYFYNDNLGFVLGNEGLLYRTGNGGGLSINENNILEKKIKVYPVPAKDIIELEISQELSIINIQIYNIQGQLIKIYKNSNRKLKVCDLSAGNYILKITTAQGELSKKIIVE